MISKPNLDFPTTWNKITDLQVRETLCWVCNYIIEYLGKENVQTIALIGSLSVGEGSAFLDEKGQIKLLSDIDIIIVVREGSWTKNDNINLKDVFRYKNNTLNSSINLAKPRYLLSPIDTVIMTHAAVIEWWNTPRIVNLQLAGSVKVIWGDRNIFPAQPKIPESKITDQDIFTLLNNRISEHIFYFVQYKRGFISLEFFVYQCAKASVDVILSVCIVRQCFHLTLLERIEAFSNIGQDLLIEEDMLSWARFWTNYKLTPKINLLNERFKTFIIESAAIQAWDDSAKYLIRTMRWIARIKLGFDSENIYSFFKRLSIHYGLPFPLRPSIKIAMSNPFRFFKELRCIRSRATDIFIRQLSDANLPIPEPNKIKNLFKYGSPLTLTYASAALLLIARNKSRKEKKNLLRKTIKLIPISDTLLQSDLSKCWLNLSENVSLLWNCLVMDGRK